MSILILIGQCPRNAEYHQVDDNHNPSEVDGVLLLEIHEVHLGLAAEHVKRGDHRADQTEGLPTMEATAA